MDLAAELAGIKTVGQCEQADYPYKVLCKHWPDVYKWRDIRMLNQEEFYERTGLRTVDVISGGFPCQPFSVAGKRRGKEDDRYLWPEMLRVIEELRPAWVVGENVAGIVNMELDAVLSDLESQGYSTRAFIIPACGVGAPHRRYRVAIVARCSSSNVEYPNGSGRKEQHYAKKPNQAGFFGWRYYENDSYSNGSQREWIQWGEYAQRFTDGSWWESEPGMDRVAYGVPHRVDRVRCLGNAVVPAQFYPIFKFIAEIEEAIE